MPYDSADSTKAHIARVRTLLADVCRDLAMRGEVHDQSKLSSEEKEIFDEYTPKLKGSTYGSDEYKTYLVEMKVALDHHYAYNRHHPEYYENGILDMNLIDLIEMLMDWKAASERHENGNIWKSLSVNAERFNIPPALRLILINTVMSTWPNIPIPEPETNQQIKELHKYLKHK